MLADLGAFLRAHDYQFITITPESHARVLKRGKPDWPSLSELEILRQLFGWNRSVPTAFVPKSLLKLSGIETVLAEQTESFKSSVRVSTLGPFLFVHSGYPTQEKDSVFFGPDSYRFANWIRARMHSSKDVKCAVDLGCGTGVGAFYLSHVLANVRTEFILVDPNERALEVARQNLEINRKLLNPDRFRFQKSNLFDSVESGGDLVIANPPFIVDAEERAYRHGGRHFGCDLSAKMVRAALKYLPARGRLLMYTGSSIVRGHDIFRDLISPDLAPYPSVYTELDPDLFGEELSQSAYSEVDRIAAVGLDVIKT